MWRKSLVLLVSLMCLVVGGCSDENPVNQELKEEISPLDELVIANCYAVQAAAEAYAEENNGSYPEFGPVPNLENPYTNGPTRSAIAVYPGETSYLSFCRPRGTTPGYLITGFGATGEVIALSNLPRGVFYFEEQTVANCLTVKRAAEAFAADNEGEYPGDTRSHTNLLGRSLLDYLPGGSYLTNPYTLAATEPGNHWAGNEGETG